MPVPAKCNYLQITANAVFLRVAVIPPSSDHYSARIRILI